MWNALIFGLMASSAFVIGVFIGLFAQPPRRILAAIVAFGAGVLVFALSFELIEEAIEKGTMAWTVGGFMTGAVLYVVLDQAIDHLAARSPRRHGADFKQVEPGAERIPQTEEQATVSGLAVLMGTALDGIPENAAIGVGLAAEDGQGLGLVLMGAVFLSNLPGAIASTVGMRAEGRSMRYVLVAWGLVAVACTASVVGGYAWLTGLPENLVGALLALAAGGIIAMLADTMMPEAFREGGPAVALATAAGFACSMLLAQVTGG